MYRVMFDRKYWCGPVFDDIDLPVQIKIKHYFVSFINRYSTFRPIPNGVVCITLVECMVQNYILYFTFHIRLIAFIFDWIYMYQKELAMVRVYFFSSITYWDIPLAKKFQFQKVDWLYTTNKNMLEWFSRTS